MGHFYAIQAVSFVQPVWVQEILNSYATDPQAERLLMQLAVHSSNDNGYTLEEGVIRYKGRLWVANNSALQTKIIAAFHSSPVGGHSGNQATYHRVKKKIHWKGLKIHVEDFVR